MGSDTVRPSPPGAPIRLVDLARQVGLDPSTVSRVLRGDPKRHVSEATRQRIIALAEATGYRPNRLARSLKLQRTNIIAILIPDISNPFFGVLLRAVEDVATSAGYNVILCNTDDRPERFQQHLHMLLDGHVDGLLLATARRDDPMIEYVRARGMPYVLVNRRRDAADDWWVIPDDRAGAGLAVQHLAALGHRRIAHLAGSATLSTTAARRDAFAAAMAAHALPLDERLVIEGGLTAVAGGRAMGAALALPPAARPTAVFAANDPAALGAIETARAHGLRVPDDLSVVGYNDTPPAGLPSSHLTTIRVPLYEMGQTATRLLIRRLIEPSPEREPDQQIVLPVELVVRESTGPLPGRAARPADPGAGRAHPRRREPEGGAAAPEEEQVR